MTSEQRNLLIRQLYIVDRRLRRLKELSAPKPIIANDQERYDSRLAQCRSAGMTDAEYKKFCDIYDLESELLDLSEIYADKCVNHFRRCQQEDRGEISIRPGDGTNLYCDMPEGQSCSPFCPQYTEASTEQISNFFHGLDIDTGEPMPEPEMEEEEGEDQFGL